VTKGGALRLALASLILWFAASPAAAHRTSLAHVTVEGGAATQVILHLSAHDLAVALGLNADPATPVPFSGIEAARARIALYLDERLALRAGEQICTPGGLNIEETRPGEELSIRRTFACPSGSDDLVLTYRLFFEIDGAHRAIVEAGGRQAVIDRDFTTVRLVDVGVASPSFSRLLALGVEHILLGIDHVLFLVVLMLGLPRIGPAIVMVSAFTLAHSITLALAWYGLIALPPKLVETVIALSIAYVAAENLLGRGIEHRWLVAGLFGLIHGLGFYSVLADLGFEGTGAVTVLLGFNLGVEIGQLMILAAAAPLLWWTSRRSWRTPAIRTASAACLLLALWWAAERVLT
jgi:hypothetical protein